MLGQALIVRTGTRACAIPVQHVGETLRPLPLEPLAGTPAFVRGVSIIRGAPLPVLDLGALLEGAAAAPASGRWVTVKVDERRFALGVDAVDGVRDLSAVQLVELPPVLEHAGRDCIEALGSEDAQLLLLLRMVRLVPDHVWQAVTSTGAGP